jgi:hypothetical protein
VVIRSEITAVSRAWRNAAGGCIYRGWSSSGKARVQVGVVSHWRGGRYLGGKS